MLLLLKRYRNNVTDMYLIVLHSNYPIAPSRQTNLVFFLFAAEFVQLQPDRRRMLVGSANQQRECGSRVPLH